MKIQTPTGETTRPTAAKAREAVMQMLSDRLDGALFVDFFAGSGAMGLEALSRGCASCYFVDNNSAATQVIEQNLSEVARRLKAQDLAGQRWFVIRQKADRCMGFLLKQMEAHREGEQIIIYADPPYGPPTLQWVDTLLAELSAIKLPRQILVVVESAIEDVEAVEAIFAKYSPGWEVLKTRKYGKAAIYFIETLPSS
jgi:16S rRNA (guanine966-N2)-methyltransferase